MLQMPFGCKFSHIGKDGKGCRQTIAGLVACTYWVNKIKDKIQEFIEASNLLDRVTW